jgi:hypothetical protein
MLIGAIGVCGIVCGLAAIRATRLAIGALWLAGVSVCLAVMLYALGAVQLAAVELSVGISLVTVLLVYGIAMAGEGRQRPRPIVPRSYAATLAIVVFVLAATLALPVAVVPRPGAGEALAITLWSRRGLDVVVQVVMICVGALGVLIVLGSDREPARGAPSRNGQGAALAAPREEALR